jgi:rfaE bifunctional protein nucleotidyltransferase chain/domain
MYNSLADFILKNKDKKVVFTNGCFDILHRGHVTYLNEAKAQGDILIVGLNSDASVKRLKGETRPVNSELDRKFVLENLKAIDFVEIFTEDTPLNLIKQVMPDVLVKGGDWKPEQIVGSKEVLANGGEVRSLNFVNGFSTTSTIEKIQS